MNYGDDHNPYAPPTQIDQGGIPSSDGDDELQFPAERTDRFLARLLDSMLTLFCMIPWMIFLFSMEVLTLESLKDDRFATLMIMPAALPLAIYQWIRISKTGQTIGKKWMRIRVVRLDGSPVTFGEGVVLREWITQAIAFIPCVGPLVNVIGQLMIFGDERRCLHDRLAGTKVIKTLAG